MHPCPSGNTIYLEREQFGRDTFGRQVPDIDEDEMQEAEAVEELSPFAVGGYFYGRGSHWAGCSMFGRY
jgi:hypothetical protein